MPENKRALNYRGKCVICGDSMVGKTALTQVFCSDGAQYPKTYLMTTGVDMVVKNVNIQDTVDTVEMFLYDMAGKNTFDDIVESHLQNVQMIILIYDVTNDESFHNILNWHKKIEEAANNEKTIPGVLVANKIDLTDRQVVPFEKGEELAAKLNFQFVKCSAKDIRDVDTPFLHLANDFYERQTRVEDDP